MTMTVMMMMICYDDHMLSRYSIIELEYVLLLFTAELRFIFKWDVSLVIQSIS